MRRADRNSRGFTLLEVVASVAILGGVIVGLLAVRQRAQHACRLAHEMMTCTRLCASRVALLRTGEPAEGAGDFACPKGYTWHVTREALPPNAPDGLAAFRVRVSAASGDDASSVSVAVWLQSPVATGEAQP